MPKTRNNQAGLYGHDQDHAAEITQNRDDHLTPTHSSKMPEALGSQNAFFGEHQGNTTDIGQSSQTSTGSENPLLKHKKSAFLKAADNMLGHSKENKITPKKSMTNLVTSPKASHEKKSLRNLFHRKGSRDAATPPSSSGKTVDRMTISAPTLIDASPGAKNAVNYSRPIALHPSIDVSNGSPVVRGRSSSAFPFASPSVSAGGSPEKSPNTDQVQLHDRSNASATRGNRAVEDHDAISETLPTEENPDASDNYSFDPSEYSGDENSVQQAVAMPIAFSGRAKLVDVRPPRGTNAAASRNRSGAGIGDARVTTGLTETDAEVLGAQDADRYYNNAMNSQTRPTTIATEDPFIDPAYDGLLEKPANEIAAKEMARVKAAREAKNMGGGLMERMNALLAKRDSKPANENLVEAAAETRTTTGESLLSKMRALGKRPKKEKEHEDGEEEVVRKVKADVERGIREEKEIHAIIKAKLAAKDAANGGVRGAGIPRIDYGPPNLSTALGGSGPTDEERAHARNLAAARTASRSEGQVQNKGDNTTARGKFEGC